MFHDQTEGVVAIRRWRFEDLDAVYAIERQAGANAIDKGTLAVWTMTTYDYRGYVITEDEEVRGYAILFLTRNYHADIQAFRVSENHRRRRFGTRLLAHLVTELPTIDKSGKNRWQSLLADIDSKNEAGLRLFGRVFTKTRIWLHMNHQGHLVSRRHEMTYPRPSNFTQATIASTWPTAKEK